MQIDCSIINKKNIFFIDFKPEWDNPAQVVWWNPPHYALRTPDDKYFSFAASSNAIVEAHTKYGSFYRYSDKSKYFTDTMYDNEVQIVLAVSDKKFGVRFESRLISIYLLMPLMAGRMHHNITFYKCRQGSWRPRQSTSVDNAIYKQRLISVYSQGE
jgi:hypothetical protein